MKNFINKIKVSNKNINERGFTLIEALVGMAIILIAIIGPLSVSINGIKTISQNKNRIIASYLAEEIGEEIRNYRDYYYILCTNGFNLTTSGDGGSVLNAKCGETDVTNITNINDRPQDVAFKKFLNDLGFNSATGNVLDFSSNTNNGYIDQTSFVPGTPLISYSSCATLYLDYTLGTYSCGAINGQTTVFERSVTLKKISAGILKVETNVKYSNYNIYGVQDKSVNVIDYIYER